MQTSFCPLALQPPKIAVTFFSQPPFSPRSIHPSSVSWHYLTAELPVMLSWILPSHDSSEALSLTEPHSCLSSFSTFHFFIGNIYFSYYKRSVSEHDRHA